MLRPRAIAGDPVSLLRRAVDRAFEEFPYTGELPWLRTAPAFPALNVWDDQEHLLIEAELPGVSANDLEVYAVGRTLTIRGKRNPRPEANQVYHRQERGMGEFARVIELPTEVDADGVQATMKDGVLTVRLPKAQAAKRRMIAVQSA